MFIEDDPTIEDAVGPPWDADPTIYTWHAAPHDAEVRFQFRAEGAVLEVNGETIVWKDARAPSLIPPHPPPTGLVEGIDVASYQDRDLSQIIHSLSPSPEHVIVRLYQELENPPQEHSRAQIESARANGCTVGAYCWIYRDVNGGVSVDQALDLADRCSLAVPVLWLDIETYTDGSCPGVQNIASAVEACIRRGVQAGIYTGEWVWRDHLHNTTAFHDLPLWHAAYGNKPLVLTPVDYGGWGAPSIWQWTSDPVDRNVVAAEVTVV